MNNSILPRLFIALLWLMAPMVVTAQQGVTEDYGPVVAEIVERGEKAVASYTPDSAVVTGNEFSRLYFDVFESSGMEFTLGLKDQSFMLRIESGFSQMISLSMRGGEKSELEKVWSNLKRDLDIAVERYSSGGAVQTFWGLVLQSFLILFREGVEAMLVVAALTAYLRRSGYADKVKVIWHGVVWALVASVAAAWLLNSVFEATGAQRETMEGVTMLIAAAVLVYVSYWLFAKRETERWQAFIRDQMDRAIKRSSLFALGFVAFLAVFREGAETILFYQALMSGASDYNAIWTGMGIAAVVLLVVYLLIRLASIRLPLGLFFGFTAVLLFAMAFVFTGKGILELQVGGLVPTTPVDGVPMVSWLGLFPTVETLLGQMLILAMLPLGWLWLKMNQKSVQKEQA
ncbi:MAG: FTR1 family iron permease [Chromatiales bacterium]|nr:FTR1 family iron permease [Chromatiales bacterium]